MKRMIAATSLAVFALAMSALGQGGSGYSITNDSAGPVKIGMTVAEAEKAMPGFTFKRTSDGEGVAWVQVSKGNEPHMYLYAGEEDPESAIDSSATIEYIAVVGKDYKTAKGVHPGMKLTGAEGILGRVSEIAISEIESREYVIFAGREDGFGYRLLNENGMAGIYPSGARTTSKFDPGAYIYSIAVTGGAPAGISSAYTDLDKDCEMQDSEEGAHTSTFCKGYGGYRLHIFDSATTLEFNIERGDEGVRIASQSLSYPLKESKLEWRLADGEPFAVILRTYHQRGSGMGRGTEMLTVRGLNDFQEINHSIDVRTTPNANEKAREYADAAYARMSPGPDGGPMDGSRSLMQLIEKAVEDFEEMRSRTIEIKADSSEDASKVTVIVTDDGYMDDSVRGKRTTLRIEMDANGVWQIKSSAEAWRCWEGRGHTDFSTAPCL